MPTSTAPYQPISCEFHDLLENRALSRQVAQIRFLGTDGAPELRSAAITDVFAKAGAEYLSMSTGETLRLDRLLEVDGTRLADYC